MIRTSRMRENAVDRTQIERFLAESLADRKLTGSEKQTLAAWVADHAKNDQQKACSATTHLNWPGKPFPTPMPRSLSTGSRTC